MRLDSRRRARLEDPGAEALDRVTAFWTEYGRIVLGVFAAVIAVVAIFYFVQRGRLANEEAAAQRLAEANLFFWQGQYTQSLDIARDVSTQFSGTKSGVDAYRLIGDNAFWTGDYAAAAEAYRTYLDKEKSGLLHDAVSRSLAYTLETQGQYAEAGALYASLVGKFDRESDAEFLVAAARSYREAGQDAEAVKHLQRLVDEYGETSYARSGREMLAELQLLSGSNAG